MSKRNTKEEIILATLELAAENGLGSVSMQQIADRVGIRKASLYNHYQSKDEIVEAMYGTIRQASKDRASISDTDYDALVNGHTLREVLTEAVGSYKRIVDDPQMNLFYRVVMNERTVSPVAAEIMVKETRTMIDATADLFRVLQNRNMAAFRDVDSAAFYFAMAVHSAIDYCFDLMSSGEDDGENLMASVIDEFCRL